MRGASTWYLRQGIAMIESIGIMREAGGTVASAIRGPKKLGRFSDYFIRKSTTLAAIADEEEEKKKKKKAGMELRQLLDPSMKSKSLYFCFFELTDRLGGGSYYPYSYVIRSIKLSDVFSTVDGDGDGDIVLRKVASKVDQSVSSRVGCCVFGSQILYGGGVLMIRRDFSTPVATKEIYALETHPTTVDVKDTDAAPSIINLKPSSTIKEFTHGKPDPILAAVDGKLYCLDFSHVKDDLEFPIKGFQAFEVFDPSSPQQKWLPLQEPPLPQKPKLWLNFVILGNKFIVSESSSLYDETKNEWKNSLMNQGPPVLWVYDVTQPERGWIDQTHSCLGSWLPFLPARGGTPYCVNHHQAGEDGRHDGFLIFEFNCLKPETIPVFFLSRECDYLRPMQPLHLPPLPPHFGPSDTRASIQCSFVNLGGPKVCLVLNRFFSSLDYDYCCDGYGPGKEEADSPSYDDKGCVLLLTFEYEITGGLESDEFLKVEYRFLDTHHFQYSAERPDDPNLVCRISYLQDALVL